MTKIKKLIVAVAAVATIGALGIGAYAADESMRQARYINWEFEFDFSQEDVILSPEAVKEDYESYARVHNQSGNIGSNMGVYYTVYTSSGETALSETVRATNSTGTYDLDYTLPCTYGSNVRLQGEGSGSYIRNIYISGYWNP